MRNVFMKKIGAAAACAAVMLSLGGDSFADSASQEAPLFLEGSQQPEASVPLNSLAPLVRRVKPGVVNIYTLSVVPSRRQSPYFDPMDELIRDFFEGQSAPQTRQSLGSGFILNSQGFVVTNNHVVAGAARIRVGLSDGREFSAHPVGLDPKTDLALLKLEGDGVRDLPVVPLGDSDSLEVGDFALAVGNPFGLDHSVSLGIVSAKERVIGAGPYDDFIQTDTAINPGNSGGPLFNLRGEVIGVNTAIMAKGQGIGFAVPVNMLKTLLPQLIHGRVLRGWLGVSVQNVPPAQMRLLKMDRLKGAFVQGVIRNGPAHRAGIRAGDVIVDIDGVKINSYNHFSRVVAALTPGNSARLKVIRNGKQVEFVAKIDARPDERGRSNLMAGENSKMNRRSCSRRGCDAPGIPSAPEQDSSEGVDLGVTLKAVSRSVRMRLGIAGGVEIVSMDKDSPLAKGGVKPGDVILEMQRRPVYDLSDFGAISGDLRPGERLLLRLQRGDTSVYVAVKL